MSNSDQYPGRVTRVEPYGHPHTATLYDLVNPFDHDTAFYLQLASELSAATVVDIGCGTGLLAVHLASHDRRVTALDPSPDMLQVARDRTQPPGITWVEGDVTELRGQVSHADLAVMTGHVAQHFLTEAAWRAALRVVHDVLAPGGTLAFETRNPDDQAWLDWKRPTTHIALSHESLGQVEAWVDVQRMEGDVVIFDDVEHYSRTGETLLCEGRLRFPSVEKILASLDATGFDVENTYGSWDRTPFTITSPELIVVAKRR